MPHLPPLQNAEANTRTALEQLEVKLGRVPNVYRTFAHSPRVLNAAVAMAQAIRAELDPKLRELAYLKVTQITDCSVCRHGLIETRRLDPLALTTHRFPFKDIEKGSG